MTDSRNNIGAPYPARRDRPQVHAKITDFRDPTISWHVRCLRCHAAGMFFHKDEAQEWAEAHQCPPKDAA